MISVALPLLFGQRVRTDCVRKETMKPVCINILMIGLTGGLALVASIWAAYGQVSKRSDSADPEMAIRARLGEIQVAAQKLDPEKVFSFVLENKKGALAQNGTLFLTREEALDSTRQAFSGLQKVEYQFKQQHITMLSPGVALAIGEGSSSATTADGRSFSTPFVQSVVLVLTNGEWKVFHAHRSFPPK